MILGRWLANKTPEIVAGWIVAWQSGSERSLILFVAQQTDSSHRRDNARVAVLICQQSLGGGRNKAPMETAWAAADARFPPSGSRSEAGEAHSPWPLREGFTFRANARLKFAVGTAGEVQQESGPAARVDELGSSVSSRREHNSNQDARCFPSIRLM